MLICDLPCQVCDDRTLVKFGRLNVTTIEGDVSTASIEIYCPEHNAGRDYTTLLRESADELHRR